LRIGENRLEMSNHAHESRAQRKPSKMPQALVGRRQPTVTQHLDLRVLSQFLVVCTTLNMSAAARNMGMTPPAVSQVVLRLEHELGVNLFERTSHGLRLTPAGVLLRERAHQLIESEAEALQELNAYRGELIPRLRLYVLDNIGMYLVNAIVPELAPFVRKIEVLSGRTLTHVRDFISGEIDILVSPEEFADVGGLDRHRLCRQAFLAIAPAALSEGQRNIQVLVDDYPLVRLRENSDMDLLVQTYLDSHGLNPPRTIECDSPTMALELITGGYAWTIVTPLAASWIRHRRDSLAWLPLPPPSISQSLYLVADAEKFLDLPSFVANRCRAALRQEMQTWAGTAAEPGLIALTVDEDR
jgi:DNA-binding transcriptional LysR family regulator